MARIAWCARPLSRWAISLKDVPVEVLGRMLSADHPNWQEEAGRRWVPRDQVRTNAAIACAQLGQAAAPLEPQLFRALDDSCGHVGAFALSALQQIGSPTATQAAMDYLYSHGMRLLMVNGSFAEGYGHPSQAKRKKY